MLPFSAPVRFPVPLTPGVIDVHRLGLCVTLLLANLGLPAVGDIEVPGRVERYVVRREGFFPRLPPSEALPPNNSPQEPA